MFPGEVHALMGENGAGKSTLMKILSGAYTADPGGEIRINGTPVTIAGPLAAKALGVSIIYQELALAPNLTVAENIYLGREPKRGPAVDRAGMVAGCADVLNRLGAEFGPNSLVADLSIAERQMVEVARAIYANSKILVMDEPTTALSSRETEKLFAIIRPAARPTAWRSSTSATAWPKFYELSRARHRAARRHLCRHAGAGQCRPGGDRAG